MDKTALIDLAKQIAQQHGIDPVLLCAVIEQESNWDTFAIRFEPAFKVKYVDPQGLTATEATARSFSWGLPQLMGQVARELGFRGYLSNLCDPAVGIEWGARHLKNKIDKASGDIHKALLLWNGGGTPSYPDQVLARMKNYGV